MDGTTIYTDEATAHMSLPNRKDLNHPPRKHVRGKPHTKGVESFLGPHGHCLQDQPEAPEPLGAGVPRKAKRPRFRALGQMGALAVCSPGNRLT